VGALHAPLVHDDRKGLEAYVARHEHYAIWEATVRRAYLVGGREGDATIEPRLFGNAQERRRFLKHIAVRLPFEPVAWFLYHYVVRLGMLEGHAGFLACRIRASYIANVRRKVRALRRAERVERMERVPRTVVFLNRFYWPDLTATAQMLTDLAEDMAASGWRVTVVTGTTAYDGTRSQRAGTEVHNGVVIARVAGTSFGRGTTAGRLADYATYLLGSIWQLCRLQRQDAIVAMSDPPFLVAIAALLGRARRWRVVYWVQDLYPQLAARLGMLRTRGLAFRAMSRMGRRINSRCDLVIALGPRMRDALIEAGSRSDRTIVLHNWADAEAIRSMPRGTSVFGAEHALLEKFVVLYSGNLGRAHTFDAVVAAMTALRADPTIVFVFVGAGHRLPELRAAAERAKLGNVRFFDYVPRAKLGDALSSANVSLVTEAPTAAGMLVPSKLYGILASGRPVVFVGSPDSDVATVVNGARCGVVVSPDQPECLVQTLLDLKSSETTTSAMGLRARTAAEMLFARRLATARWADALEAIL
jgi:colanic acid biosynthesis glycosyl transferase WcaI